MATELTDDMFEVHELLGEGGYGTVKRVTFKKPYKGYEEVAMKTVEKLEKNEVEIMRKLQHPNIVIFIDCFSTKFKTFAIFLEYARHGSLHNFLKDESKLLSEDLKRKWAKESALALQYLHDNSLLHRDIKPQNALIFENHILKLCDFGLAREIDRSATKSTQKGSYQYMAPEIITTSEDMEATYSKFTDIFAYGRMLFAICTRKPPFCNEMQHYVVFNVSQNNIQPVIPPDCPPDLVNIMKACWTTEAKGRPDIANILQGKCCCMLNVKPKVK